MSSVAGGGGRAHGAQVTAHQQGGPAAERAVKVQREPAAPQAASFQAPARPSASGNRRDHNPGGDPDGHTAVMLGGGAQPGTRLILKYTVT